MLKPLLGLVLIGLIWASVQIGLLGTIATALVKLSTPKGETNAGVIYRREIERKSRATRNLIT
jgi:hypothetical protein